MSKMLYKEKQSLKESGLFLLVTFFIMGIGYLGVVFLLKNQLNPYMVALTLTLIIIGYSFLISYMWKVKMKLTIREDGIFFKISPWHSVKQKIKWEDVETYEIMETSELSQWHGGNIMFGLENFYSFNGCNGLEIVTKQGDNFFFGSKNPAKLREALRNLANGRKSGFQKAG